MSTAFPSRPTLAIVGATGAVGTTMCEVVSTRPDIWGEIRPIASARSAGKHVTIRGEQVTGPGDHPRGLRRRRPRDVRRARRGLGGMGPARGRARRHRDRQVGCVPFRSRRCRSSCPRSTRRPRSTGPKGIISVPNCTTLSMICVIGVLHQAYRLRELFAASYQAASGAGQAGIDSLYDQLAAVGGQSHARPAPR